MCKQAFLYQRTWMVKAGFILVTALFLLAWLNHPPAYGDSSPFHVYDTLSTAKGRPVFVPGQLVIEFAPTTEPGLQSQVLESFDLQLVDRLEKAPFVLVEFPPERDIWALAAEVMQHPVVKSAEPNYYRYAYFEPNDQYYSYQWHFPRIQMPAAWDQSTGSGVIVAILDTGIAYENYNGYRQAPDLAGTTFVPGYDFINDDTHPNDDQSHGTHVAGTVAQTTNNGTGVAGVAFQAKLMPVKVLDANGSGTSWQLAEGIRWATDNGAQVINMSLGSPSSSSVDHDAVQYAYANGVTLVAAAGNGGTSSVGYPAAYPEVISVGAVGYDETLAPYSEHGPALDVVAPGGNTSVDKNSDGYGDGILQQTFNPTTKNTSEFGYYFFQGTSMASPHVAGAAALLIAKGTATTPDQVRQALQSTAKDLGAPGRDDTFGYGLIQVADALQWNGGNATTPTSTPTPGGPTPEVPTATPTPTIVPTNTPTPADDWEARTVQLINEERAANGLAPLTSHYLLANAARGHSQDMADNNFFSHYGSDGSSPFDRIRAAGYSFSTAGETIAGGYTSPEAAVNAWMNSSGHRAILLGNFTEVGVGYVYKSNSTYRHYWTANFAIPSGNNPTPSPTPTDVPANPPTATPTPTDVPTNTPTPIPTNTPTPTPTNTPIPSPTATPVPPDQCADLDGDGLVDPDDLQMGTTEWRLTGEAEADLNGDGVVNVLDLMTIAVQWHVSCVRN